MSSVFYTADGRKMNMERFADANATPSLEDSLRLRGNLSLDGTIRAGKFLMADGSEMKTVVQEQKVSALPDSVSFDAQGNMVVGSKTNANKLMFSTKWSGFPDDKPNGAEISNDTDAFKQLMIVGNKSAGGVRTVGTWDKLVVHGELNVPEGGNEVIQKPNGELRINKQGIMFGGPNKDREINSGQITAGLHIPNSLNIVGMSADGGAGSRRVDMWAEGGFNIYGPVNAERLSAVNIVKGPENNRHIFHTPDDDRKGLWIAPAKDDAASDWDWGKSLNITRKDGVTVSQIKLGSLTLSDNNGMLRVAKGDKVLDINPEVAFVTEGYGPGVFTFTVYQAGDGANYRTRIIKWNDFTDNFDVLNKIGVGGDNALVRCQFRVKNARAENTNLAFKVGSDDGNRVIVRYPKQQNSTVDDMKGWKLQGTTFYDYSFTAGPLGSNTDTMDVTIEMYEKEGGESFIIQNLRSAIDGKFWLL